VLLARHLTIDSTSFDLSISVYYFFFERVRDVILTSKSKSVATNATTQAAKIAAGGALTTLESMLAGAIAGSATTIVSNPIWVISTRQTVRARSSPQASKAAGPSSKPAPPVKKLGFIQTIQHILKTDGVTAFWKGLGPSLILVINPILQYTAFERLRSMALDGKKKRGVLPKLNDFEVFLLGALSKLLATGLTYPQIGEHFMLCARCPIRICCSRLSQLFTCSHQKQTTEWSKGCFQCVDSHDGHCEQRGVSRTTSIFQIITRLAHRT
jgi:hypothetical protein